MNKSTDTSNEIKIVADKPKVQVIKKTAEQKVDDDSNSEDEKITTPKEMSYSEYLRRKRPHVRPSGDDEDDNDWSYYRSDFD